MSKTQPWPGVPVAAPYQKVSVPFLVRVQPRLWVPGAWALEATNGRFILSLSPLPATHPPTINKHILRCGLKKKKIGDALLLKLENMKTIDVKSTLPAAVMSLSGPPLSSFVKGKLGEIFS